MSQQIEIPCGTGPEAYKVVVTGDSLETFQAASGDEQVKGKQDEALVAAILAVAKGSVSLVERFKDGKLNDGPNGEAAGLGFDESGTLFYANRYKDGKLNDGPNGEAAQQGFYDSGTLGYANRFKDGKLNDGPNGEPAMQEFNGSGTLDKAARFKEGKLVKELDDAEIAAYRALLQHREQMVLNIKAALPSLRVL